MKDFFKKITSGLLVFALVAAVFAAVFAGTSCIDNSKYLSDEAQDEIVKDLGEDDVITVYYTDGNCNCDKSNYKNIKKSELEEFRKRNKIEKIVPEGGNGGVVDNSSTAEPSPSSTVDVTVPEGAPILSEVTVSTVKNDDGTEEPFFTIKAKVPKNVRLEEIMIYKGNSTDDKDMIGIMTGMEGVDVFTDETPMSDGYRWAKFTDRIYWMGDKNNIPGPDDVVTIVVQGWNTETSEPTAFSNSFTGKFKDFRK